MTIESQTEIQSDQKTGNLSPEKIIIKFVTAISGAIIGTGILIGISAISWKILAPITSVEKVEYSVVGFIFFIMILVFIASTAGNLLSTFFLLLTEKSFPNKGKIIIQNLVLNILVFVLSIPAYIVLIFSNPKLSIFAAAIHMSISSAISAVVVFHSIHKEYKKLFAVSTNLSLIISATVLIFINNLIPSSTMILFTALPIIWGSIIVVSYIFLGIYSSIYGIYNSETKTVNQEKTVSDSNSK